MGYERPWGIAVNPEASPNAFDARAPYIDNGTGRPDPARYHSPAFMAAETAKLWPKAWLLAGPATDIQEPGDFFRFDVGAESILVVRGEDGAVRAHYNVCPHRGTRLVAADFGSVAQFTCPFHSWRFGLDGKCAHVTDAETFRPDVLRHGTDLSFLRAEVVAGLVFVTMNEAAPPARDWLGVVAEHLETYRIDRMHVVQHKLSEWGANWKTGIDAFYETYHLHAVHPQTQGVMEDYRVQHDLFPGGMSRMYIPFARPSPRFKDQSGINPGIGMMLRDAGIDPAGFSGSAQEARAAIQQAKRERANRLGIDFGGFADSQLSDSVPYGLFPNVQIGCHPEGVFIMRFLPHADDPNRFFYDNLILVRPVETPDWRVPDWMGLPPGTDVSGRHRPDIVRVPLGVSPELGEVLDQDSELLPVVQAGIRSRGFRGPLWSEQELRVRHFHAELDRYLAA